MSKTTAEVRREKLRNRSRQAVQTRDQKGLGRKSVLDWSRFIGKKPGGFTPRTGKDLNLVDILPFIITQDWYKDLRTFSGLTTNLEVGDWDYKLELPVHPNVGENNDTLICHRLAFGHQCIRCDEMFEEYEKENFNQRTIEALKPKWKCWYNVYDYDEEANPDGVNMVWEEFSYHLFEKFVLGEADEGEETILYSDIEIGKSIEFKGYEKQFKTKKGSFPYTEAQEIKFKDRDPYNEDIVKETVSFDSLVKICTVDEFSRAHLGLDDNESVGGSEEGETPPEETQPVSSGRRRQAKPQPTEEPQPATQETSSPTCPYSKEFGTDCDPTADECKKCSEETFKACADQLDEIEKGKEKETTPPAAPARRVRRQPGKG